MAYMFCATSVPPPANDNVPVVVEDPRDHVWRQLVWVLDQVPLLNTSSLRAMLTPVVGKMVLDLYVEPRYVEPASFDTHIARMVDMLIEARTVRPRISLVRREDMN